MTQKSKPKSKLAKTQSKSIESVVSDSIETSEELIINQASQELEVNSTPQVVSPKNRIMPHNLIKELDSIISRLDAIEKKLSQ